MYDTVNGRPPLVQVPIAQPLLSKLPAELHVPAACIAEGKHVTSASVEGAVLVCDGAGIRSIGSWGPFSCIHTF